MHPTPCGGPSEVYAYLGRYTHRVGLSNARLRDFDEQSVRFAGRDQRLISLRPFEFIRRFLQHVLPSSFVKLRHFGLLSSGHATGLLEVARALLGGSRPPCVDDIGWRERFFRITGIDLRVCPRCSECTLVRVPGLMPRELLYEWSVLEFDTS